MHRRSSDDIPCVAVTFLERMPTINLPDGRALGYAEYGDPHGKPLFWFPGTPCSRLSRPDEETSRALGARVVSVERPGFGLSDRKRGRAIIDWPDDVAALADALEIDRFAIAGVSGAGPYLAACAHALPSRVTHVAMIGAAGPMDAPLATDGMTLRNRALFALFRHAPKVAGGALVAYADPRRDPERYYRQMTDHLSPSDRAYLARIEVWRQYIAQVKDATRRSNDGLLDELALVCRPWGFRLEDIRASVHVFHGEDDRTTPIAMARYVARTIPNARATFFENEGHFLMHTHAREILEPLLR
jgi:pimeloyl-ACP methyl ester carboxylesterase